MKANHDRMRAYLLRELREALEYTSFQETALIAVLSPVPRASAWRDHTKVPNPVTDGWYLWRDPSDHDHVHADRALVEDGKIISKWGCGIGFFPECALLDLPADVAAILAAHEAKKAGA